MRAQSIYLLSRLVLKSTFIMFRESKGSYMNSLELMDDMKSVRGSELSSVALHQAVGQEVS